MNRMMMMAGAMALGFGGAAFAQEMQQPAPMPPAATAPAMPADGTPLPPATAPEGATAPNAGATGTTNGTMGGTTGAGMPDAGATAAAPADTMAAPSAMATPKKYPVCSRTVRDECRNRGGI